MNSAPQTAATTLCLLFCLFLLLWYTVATTCVHENRLPRVESGVCTVTTIFAATYHRYHILNKLTFTISLGGEINGMLGLTCWLDAVS